MKYYASHFLWHAGQKRLLRMRRIGVDESLQACVSVEPFEAEVLRTVWLSGLIVLSPFKPEIRAGEHFLEFCRRVTCTEVTEVLYKAFYVPLFDCTSMIFKGNQVESL